MLYSKLPETMYTTILRCRVCGNPDLDPVLHLGTQALTGVFPRDRESPVPAGPLELVKCRDDGSHRTCGLVQLRHSFQPLAMYGMNYGYRSGLNQSMVDHLNALARKAKRLANISPGDLVLDIGSNDGTLLHAMDAPGLELVGMDPTGVKFRQYYAPHIRLIPEFFSAATFRRELAQKSAKLVTSIAMFYDLEAPLEFAREISEILADDGIWMFEQSYLPAMVARTSYDTICHEHLEYYGLQQMLWIAECAGLRILDVEVNNVNGGSFCVTAAKAADRRTADEATIARIIKEEQEGGLSEMGVYSHFAERVLRHRHDLRAFLQEAERRGEVIFGCGASTKGNVMLQFCDLTSNQIPFISDVNPDKFGAFTPGTLIPIISEHEARAKKPHGFLVLPWHFRDAIMTRETEFLAGGGKLIFPLPKIEVVTSEESSRCRL
jgi:C-methyltransferase C-terminal domain/Putative zinc binding domain/Methyltransferase domain